MRKSKHIPIKSNDQVFQLITIATIHLFVQAQRYQRIYQKNN